jgi:ferritin-like metal-binding protein YciE
MEHKMKPLEKLFWEELAEMVHVEEMLLKALPKMREAAQSDGFKNALEAYRGNSQTQVEIVRSIFSSHDLPAREKKCEAMMGVLLRGQQFIVRSGSGLALDAALLCVANKISGYKLGSYRSLVGWAEAMKADKVAKMLHRSLRMEESASERFEALGAACNSGAATQVVESARKSPPKPRATIDSGPNFWTKAGSR